MLSSEVLLAIKNGAFPHLGDCGAEIKMILLYLKVI